MTGRDHGGRRPDLVIFDCDGVLVDSEVLACAAFASVLTADGSPHTADEVASRYLGLSGRDTRALVEAARGRPLPDDHEARLAAELFAAFRRELKPVGGMAAVLHELRQVGVPVCVASSSGPDRIALALDVTGLASFFGPHVFSSSMVARGKPAPDLFLHAAAAMGVSPERCTVVEDSPNGVRAGRAAGMRTVGFLGGAHCPPGHGDRLRDAGADIVCREAGALARDLAGAAAFLSA